MARKIEYRKEKEQCVFEYAYESGKMRMKAHPELADKYKKIIQNYPYFKTEKEALEAAIEGEKRNHSTFQIWAKVEKDEEYYGIQDYYIASDDYRVLIAAEYIGMAQIYD